MSTQFQADNWLVTLHRALSEYVSTEIDEYVQAGGNPAGLEAYDIVFDWPEADDISQESRLKKTIIHFVIDDIDNRRLGFGSGEVKSVETLNNEPDADTVQYFAGQGHVVNWDVGVWASDESGGSTARLVVYQMLQRILGTEIGRKKLHDATSGIEIIRFNGGRFITDRINDVRVYRIVDSELVARVYSSISDQPQVIVDQEPEVDGSYEIDGTPIV